MGIRSDANYLVSSYLELITAVDKRDGVPQEAIVQHRTTLENIKKLNQTGQFLQMKEAIEHTNEVGFTQKDHEKLEKLIALANKISASRKKTLEDREQVGGKKHKPSSEVISISAPAKSYLPTIVSGTTSVVKDAWNWATVQKRSAPEKLETEKGLKRQRTEELPEEPEKLVTTTVDATLEALGSQLPKELVEQIGDFASEKHYDIIDALQNEEGNVTVATREKAEKVKVLDLRSYSGKIKDMDKVLSLFKNVETLIMPQSTTGSDLKAVTKLGNLRELNLSKCHGITNEDVSNLSRLSKLKKLDLSECYYVNDFSFLSDLTNLETLDLRKCHGFRDFSLLSTFFYLETLNLNGCKEITNEEIGELSNCTQLKHLDLSGCCGKTTDFRFLSNLTKLETLKLPKSNIIDASVLSKLTNLKDLDLSMCEYITDFSFLSNLTKLESLKLPKCKIEDSNLLSRLTKLKHLDLSDCSLITDFSFLLSFPDVFLHKDESRLDLKISYDQHSAFEKSIIRSLIDDLQNDTIFDDEREIAATFDSLDLSSYLNPIEDMNEVLSLFKNVKKLTMPISVVGSDLKAIEQLEELKKLSLKGCDKITDDDITNLTELLSKLINLTYLDLSGCKITEEGKQTLLNTFLDLVITGP